MGARQRREAARQASGSAAGLGDRAFDVWRPLLVIAEDAGLVEDGRDWAQDARDAAEALSGGRVSEATSYGVRALRALRALFPTGVDRLSSARIVDKLNADETLPFGGWNDGAGMTSRNLARILDGFGIAPQVLWFADCERTLRGYRAEQFVDAWSRYVARGAASSERAKGTAPQSQMSLDSIRKDDPSLTGVRKVETPDGDRESFALTDSADDPGSEDDATSLLDRGRAMLDELREDGRTLAVEGNGKPPGPIEPARLLSDGTEPDAERFFANLDRWKPYRPPSSHDVEPEDDDERRDLR